MEEQHPYVLRVMKELAKEKHEINKKYIANLKVEHKAKQRANVNELFMGMIKRQTIDPHTTLQRYKK
jgi:hypothetical protein